MADRADRDWTPGQLAQMAAQVAEIIESASDTAYQDPEVRLAMTALHLLIENRLRETQRM